jgi:thiol-disulfide isomerase/thioredoxin
MTPTQSQKQNRQLYLSAVLLGLLAGGLMLFYQKHPTPDTQCKSARNLAPFVQGEAAAFMPSSKPQMIPRLSFADATNAPYDLNKSRGKAVLLNLWASWCVPCRIEMPTLDRLQDKRGDGDFTVIAVALETGNMNKQKKFFNSINIKSLGFYYDVDGIVFHNLRAAGLVAGLPTSLLLDKNGCVLGTLAGPAKWDSEDAIKLIDAALEK